ncbi:MAG TPA: hypothetical protein VHZ30_07125 [Verrucomicrobiae bacterium]|nr:hypothetical protein [Verrucomicrobiae bacterium]
MGSPGTNLHRWRFFRAGGFDQVKLETGADLVNLDQLDQKLWVALACPISGLEFDPKTAALIDTDGDGRIRAPELIAAVKWAGSMLKNPDDLIRGGDSVPLASINEALLEGRQLLAGAKQILTNLGRADAPAISLADVADATAIFANTKLNGDGIIIPDTASDSATKGIIEEIAACMGTVVDRSGKPGIDLTKADGFFTACEAYDAWTKAAEKDATILPLGDKMSGAAGAMKAIAVKVDDYFGRCRLAAFDSRAAALVNRKEEDYAAIVAKDISFNATEAAGFPLAQVAAGKPLSLRSGANPAYREALAALTENAIKPLLGDVAELTESAWIDIQKKLAPFILWEAAKAGTVVEKLGVPRVRGILAGRGRENVNALIASDKALEAEAASIADVEKLIRYVRDLRVLCVNFVSFKNLYSGEAPAIFQAGVLYLDQRSCHLCLTVEDAARHAAMAGLAGAYLAYADCVRKKSGEKLSIVAIFSQGTDENLMVGRNGVFYDRKGRDYDATITKIVANPISMREAFWSPYKKLVRAIEEQVVKRSSAADAAATAQLNTLATAPVAAIGTTPAVPAPAKGAATPAKLSFDPSVIALLSVAFGALAAAFAKFLGFLQGFAAWKLPLVAIGILLVFSGPAMILAFMKLRQRNLGPILDANGWAINARAKINVPFGTKLTDIAELPPGAVVDINDRYAEKSVLWPKMLAIAFVIWWIYAIMYDVGILYKLTENWETPLGVPPPGLKVKPDKTTSLSATNSPSGAAGK